MPLFSQYSAGQDAAQRIKNNAELAMCELEMGIAAPCAAADALLEYADVLASQRKYEDICALCDTICELCEKNSLVRQEAVALIKLGSAYERLGKPDAARLSYTRSLELCRELYAREQTEISRDDLAVACFRLGFINYICGGGGALVEEARDIWKKLYEETGSYEYRRCVGTAENLLATPIELPEQKPEQEESAEQVETAEPETTPEQDEKRAKRRRIAIIVAAALTAAVIIELIILVASLI